MTDIDKNSSSTKKRYDLIDVMRGTAIMLMIIFHFCFDLTTFGYTAFDFYHSPFWLNFQILIVSIFTFVMGMSFHLAHKRSFHWQKYFKRLALIGSCALIITISTYIVNGDRFIYFGILHLIFVASILAVPFAQLYWTNLIVGASILLLNLLYQNPAFNQIHLQWIGLMTYKPATDDYEPLIPWFGMVLLGMFFARWAITNNHIQLFSRWQVSNPGSQLLRFLGIHSLVIYMLHQPIFYGLFYLVAWLFHMPGAG
jgi:uncharacterized membrane protein